jgi:hypothetical protein
MSTTSYLSEHRLEERTLKERQEAQILKIDGMLSETPRADSEEVSKYHDEIINLLDSGDIISIPSEMHRNLHQKMWMIGYMIYNHIQDRNKASFEFINSSERENFDIWYAYNYILSKRLNEWELSVVQNASKECMKLYRHPLEQVTIDEILKRELLRKS